MFEAAEVGARISNSQYEHELPEIRLGLIRAQYAIAKEAVPVIVIISGVDGAGKGELVHRLNEWLDPRGLDTHAFGDKSDEERERPVYWRFWRALPARGRMGLFFGSWYTEPIIDRVFRRTKKSELESQMKRVAFFEHMLVQDGVLVVKFWMHLSKEAQFKKLKDLEQHPHTHWRVLSSDWQNHHHYEKFIQAADIAIRQTDAPHAPWHVVESQDTRYRDLTVGKLLLSAIQQRVNSGRKSGGRKRAAGTSWSLGTEESAPLASQAAATVLDNVDLSQALPKSRYSKQLSREQGRLNRLAWKAYEKGVSSVLVFEGWDASGKGSSIRRVAEAMDARLYRVVPVCAPRDEERAHHYLWRFWRHLPRSGRMTLFDRSWYGRVLVERVEGFATPGEWLRAYREINDFEKQLIEHRVVLCKFWLHISKEEQYRRFKKREQIPYKRFKITAEDWRNREKWEAYRSAVNDMVTRTSTDPAPWTLVAGNDKRHARIQVLKTVCDRLEAALQ